MKRHARSTLTTLTTSRVVYRAAFVKVMSASREDVRQRREGHTGFKQTEYKSWPHAKRAAESSQCGRRVQNDRPAYDDPARRIV